MVDSDGVDPEEEVSDVLRDRIVAGLIDYVVLFVLLFVVGISWTLLLGSGPSGDVFAHPFLTWATLPLYGGVLEGLWNGQTIGKRVTGITVVDQYGDDPGVGRATIRNLPAAFVFGWPLTVVALVSISVTDKNQRVFDMLAGTYVVEPGEVPYDVR